MARPVDSSSHLAASTDNAATRNRANTGASLSAAPFGTSYRSAAGSSVISNGSLLDLYARSPGSFPESVEAPLHSDSAFAASTSNAPGTEHVMAPTLSSNGMPMTPIARGFEAQEHPSSNPGFSIPPSDSNASVWTTASASATDSLPQSKRGSVAGFDIDAIRSVQPAHDVTASDAAASDLQPPPQIGVAAPQEDSDGSHYDEEEIPGQDSFDRSADRTAEAPSTHQRATASKQDEAEKEEVFSNALPSPPVPRRTSSVIQDNFNVSPSPSLTEGLGRTGAVAARRAAQRSSSGQLVADSIPQRWSSAEFRDESPSNHDSRQAASPDRNRAGLNDQMSNTLSRGQPSPTKGAAPHAVDENAGQSMHKREPSSGSAGEPSLDEQMRLEKELLAEGDSSRPRTLKEARERARLRKQQTDSSSPPPASASAATREQPAGASSGPRKGASLHIRDVASSTTVAGLEDSTSRSSIDSKDRPLRNPKRISNRDNSVGADRRSLSERSAPSDYSHDSGLEGAFTFDEPAVQASQYLSAASDADRQATSMDDLTDAVDSAMNDLSFGDGDETLSANDEFSTPMPPPKAQEDARPQLPTSLPSAKSLASVTGTLPNAAAGSDAVRSSPLASPTKYKPQTPKGNLFPSGISQPLSNPPLGSPVHQRTAQAPAATHRMPPSLPSRIEVYGKTLPMPKSFTSSSITVDKKRNSSWDRARTYAQYTNELLHLQTGLSLWMEVVQRPAMRQQQNSRSNQAKPSDDWLAQGTLPRSMHVRNEGSYADSIRSDMTFPMRGDGGKAKEIVSVMPTMAESPVQSPVNLPYPGVVQQQQQQQQPRSNSTQSFSSISNPVLAASGSNTDSLAGVGSGSRSSGRFFSGLGRKQSKRSQQAPAPASASVSNAAASSALSSVAAAVGGSRAYLANNRNSRTASPGVSAAAAAAGTIGALASARPSTDTFETSFSSHSRPESPATGPQRVSGLGLGAAASSAEIVPSPLSSGSSNRLDAVRETKPASSSSTPQATASSGITGLRAPLGPRAPNSMARTGSAQSHTAAPITPVTPITPITGAFGSGPTFVSRLGGGSFSSGGGAATPRSPGREGYTSPDFLAARRTSDLSGLSPASPSLEPASPRASAGLRSSFSYGSVRDRMRRGSSPGPDDEAFQQALTKLGDILPDADEQTLRYYLRKAKGNDLTAIGDYLQDQSLGKLPKFN